MQAASRSPPWAPTPGARIQMLGPAAARALANAWGSVAPTTKPSRGGSDEEEEEEGVVDSAFCDQVLDRVAIFS